MDRKTWRSDALAHAQWLLELAGQEYAIHAADKSERESDGVLSGLGARVRKAVEARQVKEQA